MGVLSNRVEKETLKAGDHIYSWRAAWVYAHHGIYVGENKVIHFTTGRGGGERVTSLSLGSSISSMITTPCLVCIRYRLEVAAASATATETSRVACSCLSCFLVEGALYRYKYGVRRRFFFAKVRGGTCTLATADPDEKVVHRASYLLRNGFRCYNLIKTNCEDFALYCKTGLIVLTGPSASGQVNSYASGVASIILVNPTLYWVNKYKGDISKREDVVKVEVEDLQARLASAQTPSSETA